MFEKFAVCLLAALDLYKLRESLNKQRTADAKNKTYSNKKLRGKNKKLLIIKGANHTDLYYKTDVIPFDKMENFFKTYLK